MKKRLFPFLVLPLVFQICGFLPAAGQAKIVQAEYYLDQDPGFGLASRIPLTPGTIINGLAFTANLGSIANGVHQLHVRARDSAGNWSLNSFKTFYVGSLNLGNNLPAQANILQAEYYVDQDPGTGLGSPISLTPGTDITAQTFTANINTLANGVHQLHVRSRDGNGEWSLNSFKTFYEGSLNLGTNLPPAGNLIRLEYFFDTDPGFGKGTSLTLPANTVDSNFNFNAVFPGLDSGNHILYVRALDDWGITASFAFTANGALPVTLVSFYGEAVKHTSQLYWETRSEQDNAFFAVERSPDGIYFQAIGQVPGNGTTTLDHRYHFTDPSPSIQGINYYRLGQTDLDGRVHYSGVIALRFDRGPLTLQLYPNPTTGSLHLGIPTSEDRILIAVYDASGKLMFSRQYGQPGNRLDLDVTGLSGGSYILRITRSRGQTNSIPFIRQ